MALSGDTALVGAPYKTVAGRYQAGAAYVFTRTGTIWSQQAELTASDGAAGDGFGTSVALSGDTALVGAPGKTVGGQIAAGAAYVFSGTGTSWSQQAELSDPDAAVEDEFGTSVALSGDTALVGAPQKTVAARYHAGAAYVFTRSGTSWSQQAELTASDAAARDEFGCSVALSGDTALVGAPCKTVGATNERRGRLCLHRSGTSWSQQAELSDLRRGGRRLLRHLGGALRQHGADRRPRQDRRRQVPSRAPPMSSRAQGRPGRSRPS